MNILGRLNYNSVAETEEELSKQWEYEEEFYREIGNADKVKPNLELLVKMLQRNENVNIHFYSDNAAALLDGISYPRYKFFMFLIENKLYRPNPNRRYGLYMLLEQLGFKRKDT